MPQQRNNLVGLHPPLDHQRFGHGDHAIPALAHRTVCNLNGRGQQGHHVHGFQSVEIKCWRRPTAPGAPPQQGVGMVVKPHLRHCRDGKAGSHGQIAFVCATGAAGRLPWQLELRRPPS